ncbi:hypothetical protein ACIRVK_42660 [Streptomyces sp. NPDC101152]|uniref:hypothetical protein n=1 Tax=Streptomyces sp. NPDC101152 TaxID=3366116 RepID=UPI0038284262
MMYSMLAEGLATENGPGLLWHALDRDGRSLCGQPLNGKATGTTEGAMEREDPCRLSMKHVAAAVGAGLADTPADGQGGERRA